MRRPMPPTTSPTNRSFTALDSANLRDVETLTVTLAAGDLVKRYGDRVALRGVSLSAGRGELSDSAVKMLVGFGVCAGRVT